MANTDRYYICMQTTKRKDVSTVQSNEPAYVINTYDFRGELMHSVILNERHSSIMWDNINPQKLKFIDGKVAYITEYLDGPNGKKNYSVIVYDPNSNVFNDLTEGKTCLSASFVGNNVQCEFEGATSQDGKFNTICPLITYNVNGEKIKETQKIYPDQFRSNWVKSYEIDEFGEYNYNAPYVKCRSGRCTFYIYVDKILIDFDYNSTVTIKNVKVKYNGQKVDLEDQFVFDDHYELAHLKMTDENLKALGMALESGGSIAVTKKWMWDDYDTVETFQIGPETKGVGVILQRLGWEYENVIKPRLNSY